MKKVEVRLQLSRGNSRLVGHLAEANRKLYFEYAAEFLKSGLWLSPFKLPLRAGVFEHKDHDFGSIFGLFDDSLPDGWGMLLMDRRFRKMGMNPRTVSPLERLAFMGSKSMGALTYHPCSQEEPEDAEALELDKMSEEVQRVWQGSVEDVLPQLLQAGGSPGGARPKVLVGVKANELITGDVLPEYFESWLIKFTSPQDDPESGLVEYVYSLMAKEAGLEMPNCRLFESSKGDRFFGVKRFDQQGGDRFHVHSLGNLIHSNFRVPNCDYSDLLKVTKVLTKNHQDLLKAFRQMVFNVATHNRDDHVKNFSYMLDPQKGWALTPSYDLTFCEGPGGEHSMTVDGEGVQPSRVHIDKLAKQFGVKKADCTAIVDEVLGAVSKWGALAKDCGMSKKGIGRISSYLDKDMKALL